MRSGLPALLLAAIAFFAAAVIAVYGILRGELHIAIFIVFPVIYGSGLYGLVVFLLVVVGFFLLISGSFSWKENREVEAVEVEGAHWTPTAPPSGESQGRRSEFGGVIFIGPVPIVFGSNQRITRYMIIAAAIIAALFVLFILLVFL
ncbi:MAG: DUF131 domain-containing protein [Methanomassiliicoccales archaeon]